MTPGPIVRLLYDDGSGPRLEVSHGELIGDEATLRIEGVGGHVLVFAADIDHLISALRCAQKELEQ